MHKSVGSKMIPGWRTILLLVVAGCVLCSSGSGATIQNGDVFASITTGGTGQVWWYRANGTLVAKLSTAQSGVTSGSAFDGAGNLFVTDFNGNSVTEFNNTGTRLGTFGGPYNSSPESIVFDAGGNAYVGQADGTHELLKFNHSGNLLQTNSPAIEGRGVDWIDLASDQHTIFYTSEGKTVKRFDTSTNTQLTDFAIGLPGNDAFALRLLSTGGLLVADTTAVLRLDGSGNIVQTYTIAGTSLLFDLNLDPDGTSFWTGDSLNGNLYKVNILTGAVEETIVTGVSGGQLNAVSIFGQQTAPTPEPSQLTLMIGGLLLVWWRRRAASQQ